MADIPDLSRQVFVVTGANSGVGYWTARAIVDHGGHVVMACRDVRRSADALANAQKSGPGTAELMQLDLADLVSVAQFATDLVAKFSNVNGLVNNAGVMGGKRRSTAQGFELQMGTNHLGHFALTAQLWPSLAVTAGARVVSLSSLAARGGFLNPEMDENLLIDPRPYSAFPVYSNTKQATLLFSQELHRRTIDVGSNVTSLAAHPGISSTNLFNRQLREWKLNVLTPVATAAGRTAFHSPRAAAQPSLRALTDTAIPGGAFVGPGALGQYRGAPTEVPVYSTATNPATAERLWDLSEQITTVDFPVS